MPSDETRRLLRMFGVAVTNFEDAVERGAPAEEIAKAEADAKSRLLEVTALVEGMEKKSKQSS